ncbi:hypothetical protein [Rhizobium rosettiformans]|uniref:hypothetical protein n=1 Tax=Rhizobium rosettiformans TaxID=1368430 RepID=UPI001931621E|nr:hypothetical protein [Rhizobium rosettiformans]
MNTQKAVTQTDGLSDDALLDVIQTNMQRLPLNDNASWPAQPRRLGVAAAIWSTVGFAAILIMGALILMVFKLVPATRDSDY